MFITNDIRYVGVNDHQVDLFEGQYKVPGGMAYNSYVILDEKIAIMDTVDKNFTHEWLDNIQSALGPEARLSGGAAHGAGPCGQRRQLHEALPRDHHCLLSQGLQYDGALLRHLL